MTPLLEKESARVTALAGAVLAASIAVAYYPSLAGPFVLDDASSIVNNPAIRHVWPAGLEAAGGTRGRPLSTLSFALNFAAGGLSPVGYHLVNDSIHVVAALIVFALIRGTLVRPCLAGRFGGAAPALAFCSAFLWALHPLQTEAVSYLAQRTECLMAVFYLSTLYCLLRGAGASEESMPDEARAWYLMSAASCWLGAATKEIIVTAPVLALLYDRTFLAGSFREAWRARRRLYMGLAGSWILVAFLLRGVSSRGAGAGLGVSPWDYGRVECAAVLHYLRLAAWPDRLVFDYGAFHSMGAFGSWGSTLAVALLLFLTLVFLRLAPSVGFLMAWVVLILAPTSSMVPIAFQPVAEHRMYLPLAALSLASVLVLYSVFRAWSFVIFAAAGLALAVLTFGRNGAYRSELVLWTDTVAKAPQSSRAHANLGGAHLHLNQLAEARAEFEEAIRLDPKDKESQNNLGITLLDMGSAAKAIESFEAVIKMAPDYPEAHYNLGWALVSQGDMAGAEAEYRHALSASPHYFDAHCNLADLLLKQGRYVEAAAELGSALELDPRSPQLHFNLGYAEARMGNASEALDEYREALRLDPGFDAARKNIAALERATAAPR